MTTGGSEQRDQEPCDRAPADSDPSENGGLWKIVAASERGTAHVGNGLPCQDAHAVAAEADWLVLICSDGAGSAARAEVGSRLACDTLAVLLTEHLRSGADLPTDCETVLDWCGQARSAIRRTAEQDAQPLREYACTLLAAAVTPTNALFFQIGDGAIVATVGQGLLPPADGGDARPVSAVPPVPPALSVPPAPAVPLRHDVAGVVFWPQGGEYAGTTYFLTDERFAEQMQTLFVPTAVQEIALFTDGLERLALKFETRLPHRPFFEPMFAALRSASGSGAEFAEPLARFLGSERINERTDDDKTLLLATRRPPDIAQLPDAPQKLPAAPQTPPESR